MPTSPALLGRKTHKGKPVRDDQGSPIRATETPVVTREEFDRIGALLAPKPTVEKAPTRKDSAALPLRVIHCTGCGSRMYLNKSSNALKPTPTPREPSGREVKPRKRRRRAATPGRHEQIAHARCEPRSAMCRTRFHLSIHGTAW
ncbi:hypothetical protein K2224_24330 [Streptomyces sp. BHT-5-2]|uniref:hypothetical protein n=1 Tax=unclassified Streptomyces TaxID=2593676 RepID=UPI001C8DF3CD|nr:hypothetical protein [Streptomyces sp. BHT-5-2]QZL05898.1 hypothetical protein K2224_24330 [Streptomyces sp. BHT-5-2]